MGARKLKTPPFYIEIESTLIDTVLIHNGFSN